MNSTLPIPAKASWKRLILIALLLSILSASLLTFFTIWLDHTNYGTQNGLWKSVLLKDYIQNRVDYHNVPDRSYLTNILYFPIYAAIIEHWFPAFETTIIQKMSIANACIGSIGLGVFFLIIFMITQSVFASLAATFFHLSCGTFLSVTTGSEDIIPAYTLFVISTFFFLLYLQQGMRKWLILSAFFYGLSWLFHWTMAIGPAPAIAVTLLVFHKNLKAASKDLAIFVAINIILLLFISIATGANAGDLLMPGKSMDSGYLGFALNKFILLYTGFVLYIIGGFQFNGIEQLKEQLFVFNWYQTSFIISSIVLIVMAVYAARYFLKNRNEKWLASLGIYLLTTFIVAQSMNAYEFGTDLQFHLQPMIWLPLAYGIFSQKWANIDFRTFIPKKITTFLLGTILLLFPAWMLAYNIVHFRLTNKGLDSFYLNEIKSVEPYFIHNLENTIFVTRGWDEFGNWGYAEWGEKFKNNCIRVSDFLENEPNESIDDAAIRVEKMITEAIAMGKLVVTDPEIIDRNEEEIVNIFSGFGQNEKAYALIHTVKEKFNHTVLTKTKLGTIYRLEIKQP